jgi:hypothetical protein
VIPVPAEILERLDHVRLLLVLGLLAVFTAAPQPAGHPLPADGHEYPGYEVRGVRGDRHDQPEDEHDDPGKDEQHAPAGDPARRLLRLVLLGLPRGVVAHQNAP